MLLPTNDEDIVKTVVNTYHRIRDRMLDYADSSVKFQNMYDSYVDKSQYPMKFKMFYPIAFSIIETILPRFVHGLMGKIPLLQIMKSHPITKDEAVYAASRLLNNKWMVDKFTWMNTLMALKEGFITGMGGGIINFKRQSRVIQKRAQRTYNGYPAADEITEESILEYNRPFFYQRDMLQVFPDLDRPYEQDMRFVFDVNIKGMDEIRWGGIKYENLDELENEQDWPMSDIWLNSRLRGINQNQSTNNQMWVEIGVVPDKPRELLQCVWREWTKKGEVIHIITIGNEKVLLRHDKLSYWPWVFFKPNPVPNEFLGRSELHNIESLQFGLNDLVNIGGDNMLMALTKMWVVGDDADADLDQFVLEPMNVIQVADINQVKSESWGDINPSVMHLQRTVIEAIQQASGISDMMRGATPPRKEFATTVLALQQAAEARIDAKIKICEKSTIVPMAEIMLRCAQEYLDEPDFVPNPDSPTGFDTIDMYSLQGVFDLKMHASSMGMKELQRAALNDFVPAMAQLMGPEADMILRLKLLKAMLQTFDLDNIEELNKDVDNAIESANQQQQAATIQALSGMASVAGAGGSPPNGANGGVANSPAKASPTAPQNGGQVNKNPMVAGMGIHPPSFGNFSPQ